MSRPARLAQLRRRLARLAWIALAAPVWRLDRGIKTRRLAAQIRAEIARLELQTFHFEAIYAR